MNYTNHSGGAEGSDYHWDIIGRAKGFTDHRHYWHGVKTPHGNTELSDEQIEHAWPYVLKANDTLKRRGITKYKSLLGRNYYQVLRADAIFAVGWLSGKTVQGGTAWAVQMALNARKTVYFYDQRQNKWKRLKACPNKYEAYRILRPYFINIQDVPTPILTPQYAGIGTRKMTLEGMNAIEDVYNATIARDAVLD